MDDVDRRLLSLLQANAREPAAVLARTLKVARTTVVARIARLEREGVISGYGVRLGQRVEQAAVQAYCGLKVAPKRGADIVRAIEGFPEVEELSAVSGEYDYMVVLRCETNEALDALLDRIGLIEGVEHTRTSVVLGRKVDRRSAVPGSRES